MAALQTGHNFLSGRVSSQVSTRIMIIIELWWLIKLYLLKQNQQNKCPGFFKGGKSYIRSFDFVLFLTLDTYHTIFFKQSMYVEN